MTTWLRRNRWYLVALAVLIPGAFLVSLTPRFLPYLGSLPQYEDVALGETARYSGADLALTDLVVLDGDEIAGPAGADVVVATFTIDVVDPRENAGCRIYVVSTEGGVERSWEEESFLSSDYEIPEEFEQTCSFAEAGRYDLQVTIPVPHGQVTEPVIELSSSAASPRVLRLH